MLSIALNNFKDALYRNMAAVPLRTTMPELNNVFISCSGGSMELFTTTLEGVSHWEYLHYDGDDSFDVSVNAKMLNGWVSQLRGDVLDIEFSGKRLNFSCNDSRLSMQYGGIENKPLPNMIDGDIAGQINGKDFSSSVKTAMVAADNGDIGTFTTTLCIHDGCLYATDGVAVAYRGEISFPSNVVLYAAHSKFHALLEDEIYNVVIGFNYIVLYNELHKTYMVTSDTRFPVEHMDAFIDVNSVHHPASVSRSALVDALRRVSVTQEGSPYIYFSFSKDNNTLTISNESAEEVVPATSERDIEFIASSKHIPLLVKNLDVDDIVFTFSQDDHDKRAIIMRGNKVTLVIMPMRVV